MVKKQLCINCSRPMKLTTVKFKGQSFEALECPKCREKIFTKKQLDKVIVKLESKRIKESYLKTPIKIGHSWGITFPKDIVDVFGLADRKAKLKLLPDLERGVIEIKTYF